MTLGFADVHNHQFANLGFGGLAFWGKPSGAVGSAVPWCTPAHGPGGVDDVMGNLLRTVSYSAPGPGVGHLVGGDPQFDGWPRWDSVSHQAVHQEWLRRAVDGGLRLMVMLAVNNEGIAHGSRSLAGHPLDDMGSADLQLRAAKEMEADIDRQSGGGGKGWYRIVGSSAEAQDVINQGKLAVVLGIEVDFLFDARLSESIDEAELMQRLTNYYDAGVRHLFPIHFADNGFGGAAFQNNLEQSREGWANAFINPAETIVAGQYSMSTEPSDVYAYRTGRRNTSGLTDLGRSLITGMIERGMIIDVDHMSWKSRDDVLTMCEQVDYPVCSGHTGFTEISNGEKKHEGQLTSTEVARIMSLHGMVSVIPNQGDLHGIQTWHGNGTVIDHTCGRSSQTLAQAYLYAIDKCGGRPVGFGTDLNGFAGEPGPRFGREACRGGGANASPSLNYPFTARASGESLNMSVVGNKTYDFNDDGLAHVGLLPDLIADFEAMGMTPAELEPICNSAQGYIDMWAKAETTGQREKVTDSAGVIPATSVLLAQTK